jgi:hypothetical protein
MTKKMKCCAVLLTITGLFFCGCAGRTRETTPELYRKQCDIRSAYEILDIDYIERLECDIDNIFYIRSIVSYHEYFSPESRRRYRDSAATYINGIYKYNAGQYLPICEIPGDQEKNGFGRLHKINSGGGEFNKLVELKTYYNSFHNKKKQFFIELTFSPYRGEATTLYAFDFDDLSKPILNLTTSRIKTMEQISEGMYKVEVIKLSGPNGRFLLVFDDGLREYIVQDINGE